MKMLGQTNEVLVPLSYIKDDLTSCKGLDGMVPVVLHPSSEVVRYTAYADDVSGLVTSSAKVEEVSKEIGRYRAVIGAKINCKKSVGLQLGLWKGCDFPSPFIWRYGACKTIGVWFGPDLQLEKNCSELLEKVVPATELWLCRRHS